MHVPLAPSGYGAQACTWGMIASTRRPQTRGCCVVATTARDGSYGAEVMGLSFIVLLIVLYAFASIRILKQYERGVVFLLGRFVGVRGPGLTLIFAPVQQ